MSRRLRLLALAEACTYLVLLGALVWRRAWDGPDLSATTGPVHGLVFAAFCAAVLVEQADRGWPAGRTVLALLAAVVPLGGFVLAHRLLGPAAAVEERP